jgi:hypothetical protein
MGLRRILKDRPINWQDRTIQKNNNHNNKKQQADDDDDDKKALAIDIFKQRCNGKATQ